MLFIRLGLIAVNFGEKVFFTCILMLLSTFLFLRKLKTKRLSPSYQNFADTLNSNKTPPSFFIIRFDFLPRRTTHISQRLLTKVMCRIYLLGPEFVVLLIIIIIIIIPSSRHHNNIFLSRIL